MTKLEEIANDLNLRNIQIKGNSIYFKGLQNKTLLINVDPNKPDLAGQIITAVSDAVWTQLGTWHARHGHIMKDIGELQNYVQWILETSEKLMKQNHSTYIMFNHVEEQDPHDIERWNKHYQDTELAVQNGAYWWRWATFSAEIKGDIENGK